MEVDFDKEIDVLLRNAPNSGGSEADVRPDKAHLFPDEIAAFAENALPEKARSVYIQHFAGCERCRKILSTVITMNAAEEPASVPAAVIAAAVEEHESWYRGLFRLPQLAAALGALVLVFSGLLALMLIQRSDNSTSSELSKMAETEAISNVPVASEERELPAFSSANAAANVTRTSANTAVNTVNVTNSNSATVAPALPRKNEGYSDLLRIEPASNRAQDVRAKEAAKVEAQEKAVVAEARPNRDEARAAMAAPAAGAAAQANGNVANPAAMDSVSAKNRSLAKGSAEPAVPEKKSGGKTFQLRNGVWFDAAYTGQQTLNYKRGTESYLRLDSSLRKTAEAIGGTVVIVWNNRAYRIR